ncbi:hypothetical protein D0Y65_024185 [Glycine soja]|uniref:CCHC-type domain-containing protein n=1 Tax=Glycine soja TaxID=3848 RepID=A0A445J138_GLYSO|nr:hypothetical protein D0Y65_024185 [Glycine soja]
MELMRLNQHEENDKKKKGIALKASSSIQEGSDKEDLNEIEEDDDFNFFVKRFNNFLRNKGNQRRSNLKPKKKGEDSSCLPECYECNQRGHLRVDCPSFKKRIERSEKKTFNDKKAKKAYITWEDNGKFDAKSNEVIFLAYSLHNKAFRIYNKRTMIIEESIHVAFDETHPSVIRKDTLDDISDSLEEPSKKRKGSSFTTTAEGQRRHGTSGDPPAPNPPSFSSSRSLTLFSFDDQHQSQDVPFEGTLVDDWKHVYSSHDARKMVCNNDANITSRLLAGEIKWFVMSILLWVHKQDLPPPIPNERTPSPPPQ